MVDVPAPAARIHRGRLRQPQGAFRLGARIVRRAALALAAAAAVAVALPVAQASADGGYTVATGPITGAPILDHLDESPGMVEDSGTLWLLAGSGGSSGVQELRFSGTTMDDLTQQPNAQLVNFPQPHGDDQYWIEGVWKDPTAQTDTWYAIFHVEYYHSKGQWQRDIVLGSSTDHGATWNYIGPILTASASQPVPAGYTESFGDGDPQFLVDNKDGYFYVYYMEGAWSSSGQSIYPDAATLYFDVARCPIADKMQPGCWQKYGDGTWNQPGLGGLDNPVLPIPTISQVDAPSNYWPTTLAPAIFYDAYLGRFMAIGQGFIMSATDLGTQNWSETSPFDNLGNGELGSWYNWCVDPTTWSRDVTNGQTCRLYEGSNTVLGPAQYETVTLTSDSGISGNYATNLSAAPISTTQEALFGTDASKAVIQDSWNGTKWSGFSVIRNSIALGPPSETVASSGDIATYVRGQDNALWTSVYSTQTGWSPFASLGGALASSPSAIYEYGTNTQDVFAGASGGTVQEDSYNGSSWSGFTNLGGSIVGAPSALSRDTGNINVYAEGTDGALWQLPYYNGYWHPWVSLGGSVASSPSAVAMSGDTTDEFVFATNSDGSVQERSWNGSSWSTTNIGGDIQGAPAAVSRMPNEINVYGTGTNGTVVQDSYYSGSWHGWQSGG